MRVVEQRFRDRLRGARKRRGWSQRLLGERIGRDGATVSFWETGQRVPRLGAAVQVATALGVTLEDLVRPEEGREGTT